MAKVATNATFDELLQDEKLVIVDFWAVWCGPCRMIAPILDQISEEMADKVTVVKCNVDDCEDVVALPDHEYPDASFLQERRDGRPFRRCRTESRPCRENQFTFIIN